MKQIHIYIGILFTVLSCKKEIGPQNLIDDSLGSGSLLVLNEGNFGFGNASISRLNPNSGEIENNQYRLINGVSIGDVLQSAKRYRNQYYFVVNNSGKIVVTDTNLVFQREILGFNSPRYIEFYGNTAYVTDLKQKAVYKVDLSTHSIVSEIPAHGWTEDVILNNSELLVLDRGDYLTNTDSNWVYVIDPDLGSKTDSLKLGVNPNSMQLDNERNLWVLTSGNTGTEFSSLTQYDLISKSILFQFIFTSGGNPSNLSFSPENERLYFINNSIFSIHSSGTESSPSEFYQNQNENFYGLNVIGRRIFAFDAKNYNQIGDVNIFKLGGEKLKKVSSSHIPSMVIK